MRLHGGDQVVFWDFLASVFGDRNQREIKKMLPLVEAVNELEEQYSQKTDSELKVMAGTFREEMGKDPDKESAMSLRLPEAFALVREASKRTIRLRHFDVQIVGGIILHRGKISEMKTGEGKTLVATLPAFLNAATGKKVHIVTVNDYLARRDAEWMGPIYEFLGLTVGVLQNMMEYGERKKAYSCDIVYGTNSEFGFDYLRDNMVQSQDHTVQGPLDYAIIDEVDSILIDEARTPLIISGPSVESTKKYVTIDKFVRRLKNEEDFTLDEKAKNAILKEPGIEKMEGWLGVSNLYEPQNFHLVHFISQSLKAHHLFKKDVDYILKDNQVMIVDEFTGRVLEGRRYSDGLHQAIEAKESVTVKEENQTLATITIQNYFRMYGKLAGMTGTALTEAQEFMEIYKLDAMVVPTNEPMIRKDYDDVIYRTKEEKFEAIIDEIALWNSKGRPVLVGTTSIEDSETIASLLKKRKNIACNVLNAKYHEKEAEIIAAAGQKNAVTIATNMAGRGTDIKLGEGVILCPRKEGKMYCWACPPDKECRLCEEDKTDCRTESQCGLYIIGSERHEARRIDNQLRGRSGRQGDPGSSRFFISLEDNLMRLFGSDRVKGILETFGFKKGEKIEHRMISSAIERAQKQVEAHNFEIRKQLLKYDDVNNEQRKAVYGLRKKLLMQKDLEEVIYDFIKDSIIGRTEEFFPEKTLPDDWRIEEAKKFFFEYGIPAGSELKKPLAEMNRHMLIEETENAVKEKFERAKTLLGADFIPFLTYVSLPALDFHWRDHLLSMDQLREVIGYRSYGQKDPLVEYKRESFELFDDMWVQIEDNIADVFFKIKISGENKEMIHEEKRDEFYQGVHRDSNLFIKKKEEARSVVKESIDRIEDNISFGKRRKKK